MIDTKGDPYLKTLDDELSFVVRHSLDVYAVIAAGLGFMLWLASKALQLLIRGLAAALGVAQKNGIRPSRHSSAKHKSS